MDENKSQALHVTGILIYRLQRQVEFLLLNDNFSHKKHWTAPKGKVIGLEDELKCALRNTIEITGLSPKDLRIEDNFRVEIKYLSGTRPKRVVYYLAQAIDHARIFTSGEGLNFHWLTLNNATEKAIYRSMQDVLRQAAAFIEKIKPSRNSDPLSPRPRVDKHQSEKNGGGSSNGYSSPLSSPVMPFENPLYKTRLCERFETEGFCPYGTKCTFAHGTAELRERPLIEEKTGTPPISKDGPENPLYKTRLCERFIKENFCQYGPKCNFAHGEQELRERPDVPPNPRDNRDRDSVDHNSQQNQWHHHGEHRANHQSNNYQRNHNPDSVGDSIHDNEFPEQPQHEDDESEEKDEKETRNNNIYQHPRQYQRSFGNNLSDLHKRSSSGNTPFPRSEIQNGIFGRIVSLSGHPVLVKKIFSSYSVFIIELIPVLEMGQITHSFFIFNVSVNAPHAQSEEVTETQPESHSEQLQEVPKDDEPTESQVSADKKLTPAENEQKDQKEKKEIGEIERKEQNEPKKSEQRDPSPSSPAPSPNKTSVNPRRRPAVNDTVSLKDLLSGNAKPENEKSWMKVVELSNDELEKLGKIKKNEILAVSADKRSSENILVEELKRFFVQVKEQSKSVNDEIKEITRIEMRHDLSKQQLFMTIIRSLYEDASFDVVQKDLLTKEKLFKTYIHSSHDQVIFLGCWEKFLLQRNTNLISKTHVLFKLFYDRDLIEEDSILEWYDQSPKDNNEVRKKF
ncbi:8289_t:CDS:2 [Ambispora gerdemannii]|uniref:8289_t:CDS:1 n=1 Tax=Ambispora gerdemannii TaxID=144530 RepID=A0A9N9CDB3_9GLOM|nr:8289_t:CDS:2 [Ambispora gerdemannii]